MANVLPGTPPDEIQIQFTGVAGDDTMRQAFEYYQFIKKAVEATGKSLSSCENVLDFGCGWGRIIRFFLKDLDGSRVCGIDCYESALELAQQGNRYCQFELIEPMPPTTLPAGKYDVIYCYSVYSHLSEEAGTRWIQEFARLLKPGGLFVATTRRRDFIEICERLREEQRQKPSDLPLTLNGLLNAFVDYKQALADYDAGKLCYSGIGGGGVLESSFYGETAIPKAYVQKEWTKYLQFVNYVDAPNDYDQNIIVMRK